METAPAARFALIIDLLCRAVAARAAEGAFGAIRGRLAGTGLVILLWTRLRRAAARLQSLAVGTAKPSRPRAKAAGHPHHPSPNLPRRPDLPRRTGWLLRPVPEAASFAAQLRHLLDDPAMRALIEAEPRAGRILRPLCRSLGIAPPPILRISRAAPPEPPPSAAPPLPARPRTAAASAPPIRRSGPEPRPGHDRQRAPPRPVPI